MNTEAERLFAFAQKKLTAAEKVLTIDIYEVAGREAYLAALAAARAIIVNSGKKSSKTHDGARTVFAALIREGLAFDNQLAKFLADGFEIKSSADYADGAPVERQDAEDAIHTAHKFLEAARKVLI